MARIVIALGGNALGNNPAEQREKIENACPALVGLISQGHEIIVSHGTLCLPERFSAEVEFHQWNFVPGAEAGRHRKRPPSYGGSFAVR